MEAFEMFTKVNLWAVLLAGISYLIIGSLWYSPLLFGKQWIRLNGFTDEDFKTNKPMWMILLLSFLSAAIASYLISAVLGPNPNPEFGALVGIAIALCWITMSKLTDVLFENKPVKLFLLHAGFDVVSFMVMGAIIGYWR
jgi:L-lactate permease